MNITTPLLKLLVILILFSVQNKATAQQKVNAANFVNAETHRHFQSKVDKGGFGKLIHNRAVISVESQYIRRMNRDTRYSSGIFDLNQPVTVILPEVGNRFQSMTITNEQHHIKQTIYEPGEYLITKEAVGTRYAQITIRTFVDATSLEDNKAVSAIQDKIITKQSAIGHFEIPQWDEASRKETQGHLLGLVKGMMNTKRMFGDEKEVDPIRHLIGTAAGYGGLNPAHAMYLNVYPEKNDGQTAYVLHVPKEVPVDAFWSISVYNKKGYFEKNEFDAYSFNNITAKKNMDGSITIHLGGDANQMNYIPITPGWSYNIRMYRPQRVILDGEWRFPAVVRVP